MMTLEDVVFYAYQSANNLKDHIREFPVTDEERAVLAEAYKIIKSAYFKVCPLTERDARFREELLAGISEVGE